MTELIFISLYTWSLIISYLKVSTTGVYGGDLFKVEVSHNQFELFAWLALHVLGMIILYVCFKLISKRKFVFQNYYVIVNHTRLVSFFMTVCILQIFFVKYTGVGVVGSDASSAYSTLFNTINPDYVVLMYYLLLRMLMSQNNRCLIVCFYISIFLYAGLKLMQGWTGFILMIAFVELYTYLKSKKITVCSGVFATIFLPLIIILAGGKVYQFAHQVKSEVRGHEERINYQQALSKLSERLTFFPNALGAIEKVDVISEYYQNDATSLNEIRGLFRPVTPGFLMTEKDFRPINNYAIKSHFPDLKNNTSSDLGIIAYSYVLFSADPVEWFIWLSLTLGLLAIYKVIFDVVGNGRFDFLIFLLLFKIFYSSSLEVVFGFGYLGLIYWLIFLILFKILRLKRRDYCL